MSQNYFEKHSKLVLVTINLIFALFLVWCFNLNIFQDTPTSEKYSLYDQIKYNLRCNGKRHIVMRDNKPESNKV